MPWLQIRIRAPRETAERLGECLEESGALSVTWRDAADQPIYEPGLGETPLWDQTEVIGLYEGDTDPAPVRAEVLRLLGAARLADWREERLDDQAWERAWMADFRPMRFGARLWICPTTMEPPAPEAVNLRLDPGLAFGTGTHPTTALCLEWLDGAEVVAGADTIDFGCGSGVLGIAALLLGAAQVRMTDIDPQALVATQENADRNGVGTRVRCDLPAAMPQTPADLVLANILAGPLVELAPQLIALTRPGGTLVLSGILAEQAETVREAYAATIDWQPTALREGWARLAGRRRKV